MSPRVFQIAHVPNVEQIEEPVCEHQTVARARLRPEALLESGGRNDLLAAQARTFGTGWLWMAASNSWRSTVAVPRFMTTTEAA